MFISLSVQHKKVKRNKRLDKNKKLDAKDNERTI